MVEVLIAFAEAIISAPPHPWWFIRQIVSIGYGIDAHDPSHGMQAALSLVKLCQ